MSDVVSDPTQEPTQEPVVEPVVQTVIVETLNTFNTPIDIITNTVTTVDTYTYHGYNVYVHLLDLGKSVTLRVSIAYLKNGAIDTYRNDGKYGYISRYIQLTGDAYDGWGLDDNYLVHYVGQHMSEVLASTYIPPVINPNADLL